MGALAQARACARVADRRWRSSVPAPHAAATGKASTRRRSCAPSQRRRSRAAPLRAASGTLPPRAPPAVPGRTARREPRPVQGRRDRCRTAATAHAASSPPQPPLAAAAAAAAAADLPARRPRALCVRRAPNALPPDWRLGVELHWDADTAVCDAGRQRVLAPQPGREFPAAALVSNVLCRSRAVELRDRDTPVITADDVIQRALRGEIDIDENVQVE